MIGAIIGAALSVGSAIYGGIQAGKAARQAKASAERRAQENENWYNRRYNEDSTQRADAQRVLELTAEAMRQRTRSAQGRKAVMGGTDESVAQDKQAAAQAMGNAAAQIAAAGEARRDKVEDTYQQRKLGTEKELESIEYGRAGQTAQAVMAAGQAAAGIANALGDNKTGVFGDPEIDGRKKSLFDTASGA